MRIFKTEIFAEWVDEEGLSDQALHTAMQELQNGLYEANLGGCVYKKRIPIRSRGKSGGGRILVAYKVHNIAIFLYGFNKKEKGNITKKEEQALKQLAKFFFSYDAIQLKKAVESGKLIEVIK